MKENVLLKLSDIKKLIPESSGCVVSNMVCLDGEAVSFMYKEYPDDFMDSGWRFLTGDESDDYLEDPANSGIYDLNTVANFDTSIIPYLDLPVGAALIRNPEKNNPEDPDFIPLED